MPNISGRSGYGCILAWIWDWS